jgi:CRP/FNR family transcriptional regulator
MMMVLGSMSADQKFASFLLNLSKRYSQRGFSSTDFNFRMTREDIANYLGLTIESISRVISKFKQNNFIEVNNKEISIKNMQALNDMFFA